MRHTNNLWRVLKSVQKERQRAYIGLGRSCLFLHLITHFLALSHLLDMCLSLSGSKCVLYACVCVFECVFFFFFVNMHRDRVSNGEDYISTLMYLEILFHINNANHPQFTCSSFCCSLSMHSIPFNISNMENEKWDTFFHESHYWKIHWRVSTPVDIIITVDLQISVTHTPPNNHKKKL